MTHEELRKYISAFDEACLSIIDSRRNIYATNENRLDQFFKMAEEWKCSPMKVAMILASKHWYALRRLAEEGNTNSLQWALYLMDVANYMKFIGAILSAMEPINDRKSE